MGYTNFWERPSNLDKAKFIEFANDVVKLIPELRKNNIHVRLFKADSESIIICGAGHLTCEPFVLSRTSNSLIETEGNLVFEFCKTKKYPYDLAVMAILVAFKHYFSYQGVKVKSDGDNDDWITAIQVCEKLFGYGSDFVLDEPEYQISYGEVKI